MINRLADVDRTNRSRLPRRGYSLVELLVVVGLIATLIGLLLPAVQQARSAARRTHCLNNLRNVNFAMLQAAESAGRFPAAGNFGRDPLTGQGRNHHSWVVDVLPWLEQGPLAGGWDKDKPVYDAPNRPLAETHVPVLACPDDVSVVGKGDLSYVVNGGVGFTVRWHDGADDCPVDRSWTRLDLDGDGTACPSPGAEATAAGDKAKFLAMGLFFNETWKWDVSRRHHRIGDVTDGLSNTAVLSENVRTGYDPAAPEENWASPNPYRTSFYIGDPCREGTCSAGNVDYARSNTGDDAINSGLTKPEGTSPVPNAFHAGSVHMAFGDGRVQRVAETIAGSVFAALASPQGASLAGTPLEQPSAAGVEW